MSRPTDLSQIYNHGLSITLHQLLADSTLQCVALMWGRAMESNKEAAKQRCNRQIKQTNAEAQLHFQY